MKILFLTPWYPDDQIKNHGIFIQEQAQALAEHHQIAVVSSKVDYQQFGLTQSMSSTLIEGKVAVHRLIIKRSIPFYNQFNYLWLTLRFIKKIASDFEPDIIHGSIGYPAAFWSWMLSKSMRVPFVITEHTSNFHNHFRSWIHKLLTIYPMKLANSIITVSDYSAKQIEATLLRKVVVIPNMIQVDRFKIHTHKNYEIRIGFLGSLETENHAKGLPILLTQLSKVTAPFKLIVGGGGKMVDTYRDMATKLRIEDKVEFRGYVNYENIPLFMNELDFFVNVSKHESFGIAIIEAMASGLPVVCFDNGGPADFVNSENGILIELNDLAKLREALEKMLIDYSRYDPIKIRQQIVERFSKEVFLARMQKVYELAMQ